MRSRYVLHFWKRRLHYFWMTPASCLKLSNSVKIVNSTSDYTRTIVASQKHAIYGQVGRWLTPLFWGVNYTRAWDFQLRTDGSENCFGHMPGQRGTRCVTLIPPPIDQRLVYSRFWSFDLVLIWWFLHYFWPNFWKKRQKPQNVDVSSNSCAQLLRCQTCKGRKPPKHI